MYSTLEQYSYFEHIKEGFSSFSTWILLQYDSRPLSDMDQEGCRRNKSYCEKHGYIYRLIQTEDHDLPPYWNKVKLVNDIIEHEECKGVMWMDTDAVIINHDMTIEELMPSDKHMTFAADSPVWALRSPFNAGVWMVRNSKEGKYIMTQWMNRYDPSSWTKHGTSWTSLGIWAGNTYEQGSFSELLPSIRTLVHEVDWKVLQDVQVTTDTFTLHFSNNQKPLRPTVFEAHPF